MADWYAYPDGSMAEDEIAELGRRSANARELALALFSEKPGAGKKKAEGEWDVLPYQRTRAYTDALHQFLKEEHSRRKPRPTGRDFLSWLSGHQFPDIKGVSAEGLTYEADGHTGKLSVKYLNMAIYRTTKYRS